MSGVMKKRNFTLQEKNLLLEILKGYKHIVENKKTDNTNALLKKRAWNDIAQRYNKSAIVCEPASGEQLRRLYTNLKARQKERLAKKREYRLAIGGGDPCPDEPIQVKPAVEEIRDDESLREQLLREEHISREIRANQLHELLLEHTKAKNKLEINILEEKLKEAKAKTELALKELSQNK